MFNNLTTTICEQAFTGQNQNPNCGVTTALDVTQLYVPLRDISLPRRFYFYLICINTERVIDGIMAPTYQPSEEPSREPSLEPSIAPSAEPSTSSSPTVTPGERIAVVTQFQLQNSVNIGSEQILGSSEDMEMVEDVYELFVGEVLVEVNRVLSEGRRHLGLRGGSQVSRRLGAEVFLRNVSIGDIADESCPTDQPNNALCQNVNGNINVRVVDIDTAAARATIQSTFNSLLLNDDRFRNIAFTIVPLVPTPLPGSNNVVITPENDGIGVNAIAGIASGAVALGLFAGVALFLSNQRQIRTKNRATNIEEIFARQNDEGITNGGGVRGGLNATLGASTANYGRKGRRASVGDFSSLSDIGDHDGSSTIGTHDHIGDGGKGPMSMDSSLESSSNAGSSGWSSSAGMSSLNTASVDSVEHGYGCTSLATIGKASGIHNSYRGSRLYSEDDDGDGSNKSDPNDDTLPDLTHLSRVELNTAIEAGDWAAVGATAALLASSDSTSSKSIYSSSQSTLTSNRTNSTSGNNSIDRARYAELDHLVREADWEGVVLAAAKYELESTGGGSINGSISTGGGSSSKGSRGGDNTSYASANNSSIGDTTGSYASASEGLTTRSNRSLNSRSIDSSYGPSLPSTVTGLGSESSAKIKRKAEIELEVKDLVRRVVPEEIDNVDEMMRQFRGKEEELVETLRTMHERSIAQREREEMRRNAKREARKSVKRSGKGLQGAGGGDLGKSMHGSLHGGVSRGGLPPAGPSAGAKKNTGLAATSVAAIGVSAAGALVGTTRRKQQAEEDNNRSINSSSSELSKNLGNQPNSNPEFFNRQQQQQGNNTLRNSPSNATADSSKLSSVDRISLERAIELGNWDAVGIAAAKIGEGSVSSAGLSDFASLDSSTLASDERESLTSSSKIGSTITSNTGTAYNQRAVELERLIERGDWTRVVAAAGRFSAADRESSTIEGSSPKTDNSATQEIPSRGASGGSGSGSTGWRLPFFSGESKRSLGSTNNNNSSTNDTDKERKSRKTSQEEEDALAQAEIWMTIAKQSKNEGASGAKGASDAADWAISRSLSRLQNADQQQTTPKTTITKGNQTLNNKNVVDKNESAASRRRNQRSNKGGSRSAGSSVESF